MSGRAVTRSGRSAATARVCTLPSGCQSAASEWLQPCAPAHPVALAIKEWVDAEALPDRSRPAQAPRLAAPFLPQQREHGVVRSALAAWGQQSEVADIVPVAVGHMIGQRGQEVGRRVAGYDHLPGPRVLGQEADLSSCSCEYSVHGPNGPDATISCRLKWRHMVATVSLPHDKDICMGSDVWLQELDGRYPEFPAALSP